MGCPDSPKTVITTILFVKVCLINIHLRSTKIITSKIHYLHHLQEGNTNHDRWWLLTLHHCPPSCYPSGTEPASATIFHGDSIKSTINKCGPFIRFSSNPTKAKLHRRLASHSKDLPRSPKPNSWKGRSAVLHLGPGSVQCDGENTLQTFFSFSFFRKIKLSFCTNIQVHVLLDAFHS